MNRRLALAAAIACLGALFSQCGTQQCDASSCASGCCDLNGTCRAGTSHWYCGGGGAQCTTCAAGDQCNASQVCETVVVVRPDSGVVVIPDSGVVVDAGCREVTAWPTVMSAGGYVSSTYEFTYGSLFTSDPNSPPDSGFDELYLEVYYFDGGLQVPYNATFTTSDTYAACETCLTLYAGCSGFGFCDTTYFAQAGAGTVSAASKDRTAGVLQASFSNLTLVEWSFADDAPVPGGGCVTVGSASWNVTWDAGTPDGGP